MLNHNNISPLDCKWHQRKHIIMIKRESIWVKIIKLEFCCNKSAVHLKIKCCRSLVQVMQKSKEGKSFSSRNWFNQLSKQSIKFANTMYTKMSM